MSIDSMLLNGDSLNELKKLPDNCVDLIATDPPYGYSFMGKEWDKALPDSRIWVECLRVLKPGGFAYIMSAPRQDVLARMMIDLEDSGFKTDFTSMYWAYATGFPKAMNVSKAIDKRMGVEREVTGTRTSAFGDTEESESKDGRNLWGKESTKEVELKTKPISEQGKKFDGSYAGYQPKPAVEVIIVCMKPIEEKSYIDQAMTNGKGVSWFDDCRIPSDNNEHHRSTVTKAETGDDMVFKEGSSGFHKEFEPTNSDQGRYPANLLVSDNAVDTGRITKSNGGITKAGNTNVVYGKFDKDVYTETPKDSGDFSRYFDIDKWYSQFIVTPKASKSEKNKGLDVFEEKQTMGGGGTYNKEAGRKFGSIKSKSRNSHPTVKPIKLMSYLVTLGSREGDVVLDPFMGSGTTPLASKNLGRKYIGIEREEEYYKICCARVGDEPTILPKNDIKESTFLQVKGYPGLEHTAEFIMPLIPKSSIYVEVFAGMGRTVEMDKHGVVVLNDMSDYAVETLKKKFPNATVTQDDYMNVINKYYNNPNAFLFLDPPWRKNIYKNNEKPVFTVDSPIEYYENILSKLENAKCKWILCVDKDEHEIGKRVSKSRWANQVIEHPTKQLYGRPIGVRMCSNMWTEVIIDSPNESKTETTICDTCGADYKGMTFEQHEQRPFHQGCLV